MTQSKALLNCNCAVLDFIADDPKEMYKKKRSSLAIDWTH